jgi:hypothetical protein
VGDDRPCDAAAVVDRIPQEVGTIMQGSFLLAAVIVYEVVRAATRCAPRRMPRVARLRARAEPPGGPAGQIAPAGATS